MSRSAGYATEHSGKIVRCWAVKPARVLRHSAAKHRREAGESVEAVSAFLDHSSLAVTTVYLPRLEGVEDLSWRRVADAIDVG